MLAKRYSFIVADRSSGAVRSFTLSLRPTLALLVTVLAIPIVWTAHARWSDANQITQLQLRNATAEIENARYRTSTTELSARITALQLALNDLSDSAMMDPRIRRALGRVSEARGWDDTLLPRSAATSRPAETFGLLHDLLNMLDTQLVVASTGVEQQRALAAATPVNLPSDGRVTARFGFRADPFTGERTFHNAVDISTDYGQPVYATADGIIASAGRSGAFGNLVKLDHGFGLTTRYGHLSKFATAVGESVSRGDLIGYAGATGRATGSHVHYEVWLNGHALNPLQLTTVAQSQSAN